MPPAGFPIWGLIRIQQGAVGACSHVHDVFAEYNTADSVSQDTMSKLLASSAQLAPAFHLPPDVSSQLLPDPSCLTLDFKQCSAGCESDPGTASRPQAGLCQVLPQLLPVSRPPHTATPHARPQPPRAAQPAVRTRAAPSAGGRLQQCPRKLASGISSVYGPQACLPG